jgi:hypothetical protein
MSQQGLSPLVQVTQQPSLVISHLHIPQTILQEQTTMPFMVQQSEYIPPAIIEQRFCIMVQEVGSSQTHVIFIPPVHFSIFIMQRGTITMFGAIVPMPGIDEGIPMPGVVVGMPVVLIGFIIAVTIEDSMSSGMWIAGILCLEGKS